MQRLQVVVDTSVLICAARSQKGASFALLSRVGDPTWQMNISSPLLLEYEAKLKDLWKIQGKILKMLMASWIICFPLRPGGTYFSRGVLTCLILMTRWSLIWPLLQGLPT